MEESLFFDPIVFVVPMHSWGDEFMKKEHDKMMKMLKEQLTEKDNQILEMQKTSTSLTSELNEVKMNEQNSVSTIERLNEELKNDKETIVTMKQTVDDKDNEITKVRSKGDRSEIYLQCL